MWKTNLKVLFLTLAVVGFYTGVAHIIPQLESEVPEDLTLAADVTPEALVAAGERVYLGAGGCGPCHSLGVRAPKLLEDHAGLGPIGRRCGAQKPGTDCKAYLYESLTNPGALVVAGFENIMTDMRRQASEEQIWAVVAYLQSQGGEVTVTAADLPPPAAAGDAAPAGPVMTATTDPRALLAEKGCIACHPFEGAGAPIGPPIDGIGRGRTADYLRRAILLPNADTAKGYEQFAGTMPQTFGQMLSADQLEALVKFLASRR